MFILISTNEDMIEAFTGICGKEIQIRLKKCALYSGRRAVVGKAIHQFIGKTNSMGYSIRRTQNF